MVATLRGECEVIGLVRVAKNRPVEALVIGELGDDREAKSFHVHLHDLRQVVRRPDDAHDTARLHGITSPAA